MSNKFQRFLITLGLRESIQKSYGKYLVSTVLDFQVDKKSTNFDYLVPEGLCRQSVSPSSAQQVYFPVSSLLAVMDDITSMAAMEKDKKHRTGVSISLSMNFIPTATRFILPHDELQFICHLDKLGNFIGFLSVTVVHTASQTIVAQGTHTKFLPTGKLWEWLFSSTMLPITMWYYRIRVWKQYSTIVDDLIANNYSKIMKKTQLLSFATTTTTTNTTTTSSNDDSNQIPSSSILSELFNKVGNITQDRFQLKLLSNHSHTNDLTIPPMLNHQGPLVYELLFTSDMKNYVGLMHGGAVAHAIEEACMQAHQHWLMIQQHNHTTTTTATTQSVIENDDNKKMRGVWRIENLDIRYLNANKVIIIIMILIIYKIYIDLIINDIYIGKYSNSIVSRAFKNNFNFIICFFFLVIYYD
jgi:acyl-coenzyme A thioesterase PaaI-like protein